MNQEGDAVYGQPSLVGCFKGHQANILALAFNPNGKQLASSSSDGSIMMWNLASAKTSLRYISGKLPVTCVDFSPSGDLMASSQGNSVMLWVPTVKGKCSEMKCHTSRIASVQFSPNGETLLTSSNDKCIKIWNTSTRKFSSSLTGHTHWLKMAKYSNHGRMVVSCSEDKTVKIWDPRANPSLVHTFTENRGVPNYVEFHPTDDFIGVGMSHNVVKLYEMRTMSLLQYYACHNDQVTSLAFHPLGHFLLSGSNDTTATVIDLVEGRALCTLQFNKGSKVGDVSFSKTGRHFATATSEKTVCIWKTNMDYVRKKVKANRRDLRESMVANCNDATSLSVPNNKKNSQSHLDDTQVQDVYRAQDYQEYEDDDKENDDCIGDNLNGLEKTEQETTNDTNTEIHKESASKKKMGTDEVDAGCEHEQQIARDDNRAGGDNVLVSHDQDLLLENKRLKYENGLLKEKVACLEAHIVEHENRFKVLQEMLL